MNAPEQLYGKRRGLFDASLVRIVFSWLTAGLAAYLSVTSTNASDALVLVMRFLAVLLAARALLLSADFGRRFLLWVEAPSYRLAILPDRLQLRTPRQETDLPRDALLHVSIERVDERRASRRWARIFLIRRNAGACPYESIPPVFDRDHRELAEELMRWGPTTDAAPLPPPEGPPPLPSEQYAQACSGDRTSGAIAVPLGNRWLRGGPYATALLGVALYTTPDLPGWNGLGPYRDFAALAVPALLMAIPLLWVARVFRKTRPKQGCAFVMTSWGLLERSRRGVFRTAWQDIGSVHLAQGRTWSLVDGPSTDRQLIIERTDAAPLTLRESFSGWPLQVVHWLLEAQRRSAEESRAREDAVQPRA